MSTNNSHPETTYLDANGNYNGPAFDAHDKRYLLVAAGLGILTAVEIGLSYAGAKGWVLALPLLSLGYIKFAIVAAEFMHLKFDSPLFRRLFIGGASMASMLYMVVLTAMHRVHSVREVISVHMLILIGIIVAMVAVWVIPGGSGTELPEGDSDDDDDHSGHGH